MKSQTSPSPHPLSRLLAGCPLPFGVGLLALGACSSNFSTYPDDDTGAAGAGPGAAGSASWAPHRPSKPEPDPGCVPSEDEDVPDDAFEDTNCDGIDGDVTGAIFVDPQGFDGGDGGIDAPVASLTNGIALAQSESKDIYLCAATYEENVVVEGTGLRIFGGYDCEDGWKRKPIQAVVAPSAGRPLTVRGAGKPVVISRVQFLAPAAVEPGESSVAALVVDSVDVRLSHLDLIADEGAPGADGETPKEYDAPPPKPPAGKNAEQMGCYSYGAAPSSCTRACTGGGLQVCCGYSTCPTECLPASLQPACEAVVSGTAGGRVRLTSCPSDDGTISRSFTAGGDGGNGYTGVERTSGKEFSKEDGKSGAPGAPAESGFGFVDADGTYIASNAGTAGAFGELGNAGSGGDGGRAFGSYTGGNYTDPRRSGAGGLGGAAGCGGYPGQPGRGGGASIALLAVRSNVELQRALLRTASGGSGGHPTAGGAGQPGGPGSSGGKSNEGVKTATDGGAGTAGGAGGHGGPGGGGPSIGVVAVGSEPLLKATVFDVGPGGPGADPVEGSGAARAASGLSQDVYVLDLPAVPAGE